jgi:hypothetical protein
MKRALLFCMILTVSLVLIPFAFSEETKEKLASYSLTPPPVLEENKTAEPSELSSSQDPRAVQMEVGDLLDTAKKRDEWLAYRRSKSEAPAEEAKGPDDKIRGVAEVRAFADRSAMTVGDRATLTVEVDHERSLQAEFLPPAGEFGGLSVRDTKKIPLRTLGKDQVRESIVYTLETFTVGSYVIPPQSVQIKAPSGETKILKTPEIFIEVKSVMKPGEKEALRDIKLPLVLRGGFPVWILVLFAAGLLTAAGLGIWFFYFAGRRSEKLLPPLPPDVLALKELARIEALGLIHKHQMKEYYYLVSNCLRKYLEDRFNFKAPEQTTEEFLGSVVAGDILEGRQINILKEYLRHCDLVKYAKLDPEMAEAKALLATTRQFIEETRPVETFAVSPQAGSAGLNLRYKNADSETAERSSEP